MAKKNILDLGVRITIDDFEKAEQLLFLKEHHCDVLQRDLYRCIDEKYV